MPDKLKRGPTGYAHRDKLVAGADALAIQLESLGFPRSNIIRLNNEAATSKSIDETLQTFWVGGSRANADRVLFYFGGHGDSFSAPVQPSADPSGRSGTGVLITYDFDPKRPTLTGMLMKDLTGRQAENVAAHHMLIALDACNSGLAVYEKLEGPKSAGASEFRPLSIIRNDTAPAARNILVAGKENQGALWNDGGVFTQADQGSSGGAD